jgi:hypothetical protein
LSTFGSDQWLELLLALLCLLPIGVLSLLVYVWLWDQRRD